MDRGGGREGKNHARRVSRGLKAKDNPFDKTKKSDAPVLQFSPPPLALPPRRQPNSVIDCGINLLSRQLARDQSRMMARALEAGVDAMVAYATDWDRISELVDMAKEYPSVVYCALGVHPDNVKRANEKAFATRLAELRQHAVTPECVAIFAGLDFSRDVGSHFPQEKLLEAQLALAAEIHLPVLVHQIEAGERLVEKLAEFSATWQATTSTASATPAAADGSGPSAATPSEPAPSSAAPSSSPSWRPAFAVHAFEGDARLARALVAAGAHVSVSGAAVDGTERGTRLAAAVAEAVPLPRLLLASNAPLHTPQNIPGTVCAYWLV